MESAKFLQVGFLPREKGMCACFFWILSYLISTNKPVSYNLFSHKALIQNEGASKAESL